MDERVLTPRNRGFLFLDSHPAGCRQLVADMWEACPGPAPAPASGVDYTAPVATDVPWPDHTTDSVR